MITKIKFQLFLSLLIIAITTNAQQLSIDQGPFKPSLESFKQYQYPEWFRDAKFGIWAHWGPQAVPRQGDWYARNMYEEGSSDYKYHLEHYGHPSKSGYKDVIPRWKAQNWNPEQLMAIYKKAGAKYFVSMASHHDNFFLWNSKIHKWNSVNMGPHKDVVSLWQNAAKKNGLKFGVSEHLAASFTWFQTSHGADTSGPFKGVPYDGNDSNFQDLYHPNAAPNDNAWLTVNPEWQTMWYRIVKELVDTYHPDLLYSDSQLPFSDIGKSMLANFYNGNMAFNKGQLDAVYTCKQPSGGLWVQDLERGVQDSISPFPWQTDTSIGDWFYRDGQEYKSSTDVLRMLVDIVSKNGNLLINIVQTPEGNLEPDLLKTLEEIGRWIAVNGEGIYKSRPWVKFGEQPDNAVVVKAGNFNENQLHYTADDIRFTARGNLIYAFLLDSPKSAITIKSFGKSSGLLNHKIRFVKLLGSRETLHWKQEEAGLIIQRPVKLPDWRIIGIKVELDK
jgi:alpha-L-fucosidase